MRYFGIDVGMKASAVCELDGSGRVCGERTLATREAALRRWFGSRGRGRVVIEASPLAEWLAREVEAAGHEAVVVDARSAKRLMASRKKTDRRDARTLAEMARTGWYRAVHRKSPEARLWRSRLQAREGLKRGAQAMQSRVRGLLRAHGLRLGEVSEGAFEARVEALAKAEVPALWPSLAALLAARRELRAQLAGLERELKREARREPVVAQLMTTPGVGELTALCTVATLDDPHRFASEKEVADYPGLAPGVDQSGERDARGRISREGDRLWRFYLVEAANSLLTRGADCALKRWGERIAERKGGAKARVAVARKLAIVLWRLWRDGTCFELEPARG